MSDAYRILGPADAPMLIVGDHASNRVPSGIELGIDPRHMDEHIAVDIGVGRVAELLVEGGGFQAILANASRLVIDLNREVDAPGLVPLTSDGIAIPGNVGADVAARIRTLYDPYHAKVEELAEANPTPFLLSIHSFTPSLATRPEEERPWHVGVLYNEDERAAPVAIAALRAEGLTVGDQLPYSGRLLNATMNRHAEAHGRHYLGIEIRQDLIGDDAGQRRLADILRRTVATVSQTLQNPGV
ncbi:N-formylglutamate amidohydrolase [Sphingobium sufflavum]|uniref:N-formylglutamate amidohydrolase n=1 Tax=Sphingobium sufflavum TaxID=1129547 RepID=UPI001F24E2FF|nr:N-formylglutamate amidohydrolase [Sphingobium sufflavum]MCE7798551.1 N-formylglutamate amidohydrolase [Sphingobium sufflavum]